jgi:ribosome-associated protein
MEGRKIALYAARVAEEKRGGDIVIYDVRGLTDVTNYFVVVTAHSRSQIRAIIETIRRGLKADGERSLGQEGDAGGEWVLLDYSDCVIHVFSPNLRAYYSLESLWGDAPKVDWLSEPEVVLSGPRAVGATGTDGR